MIFKTNRKRKKYSKPIIFLEEFHEDGGLLGEGSVQNDDETNRAGGGTDDEFSNGKSVNWGNPFEIGD